MNKSCHNCEKEISYYAGFFHFLLFIILVPVMFFSSCESKRESIEQKLDDRKRALLSIEKKKADIFYEVDSLSLVASILEKIRLKRDSLIIEKEYEIYDYSGYETILIRLSGIDSIAREIDQEFGLEKRPEIVFEKLIDSEIKIRREIDSLKQLLKTIQ